MNKVIDCFLSTGSTLLFSRFGVVGQHMGIPQRKKDGVYTPRNRSDGGTSQVK